MKNIFISICALLTSVANATLIVNEDAIHYVAFSAASSVPETTAGKINELAGVSKLHLPPECTLTKEGVEHYIDSAACGPLTHFFINVNYQRAYYPSRVIEPIWTSLDEPEREHRDYLRDLRDAYAKGLDIYAVMFNRCREKGVSPWLSFRMNDIHGTQVPQNPTYSTFWKEHPEWHVGDDRGWANGLDHAQQPVRDRMLAFIQEALDRYDADGVELDIIRFPHYFRPGTERANAPVFTEYVRQIRALCNASAKRRGHPVRLAARLLPKPAEAIAMGMDADVWAREGLVDAIIVCNMFSGLNEDAPIDEWRQWTNGKVKIIAGTDTGTGASDKRRMHTVGMYKKWAADMRGRGADGLYFYNFPAHTTTGEVWKAVLQRGVLAADSEDDTSVAAAEYAKYCRAITGREPPAARFAVDSSLDAKYDEYRIVSEKNGVAFLGANRRAVLYAVYDFLARRGGCRWFWDADIVPKMAQLDVSGLDIREKSQHEFRGTRYFAHRGLTRFQAEHWGLAEWKREIDWCVKKRLNLMMLRIGQDDVFQRAFPDVCAYPDPAKPLPATGSGYNNRSLFWPLEFRGKLREQVIAYAHARGLMTPEDCGTMTHWYSRTPLDFVQKMKPDYFAEKGDCYNDGKGTGLVWDIRQQTWIDAYWKLTDVALKTYDSGDDTLLHTMGVGERKFSSDHEENIRTKIQIDKKVVDEAIRRHPNARTLYPGWDFYYQWRGEDVRKFVSMLDPKKTIIWQYTSDSYAAGRSNPLEWGIINAFPYTFGIFLAYESGLDIRANYDLIRAREAASRNDPFCVGYILWPESAHTDILAYEYFAANAWRIDGVSTTERIATFCRDRYGEKAATFEPIWRDVVPISTNALQETWRSNYATPLLRLLGDSWNYANNDPSCWPTVSLKPFTGAPAVFRALAEVEWQGDIVRRDTIDLARTVADRLTLAAEQNMMAAYFRWKAGDATASSDFERAAQDALAYAQLMRRVLALHTDYSLNDSLERLDAVESVRNPDFGQVLLENAVNDYCASHQAEAAEHLYPQLIAHVVAEIRARMATGSKQPLDAKGVNDLKDAFLKRPLATLRNREPRTPENYRRTMLDLAIAAERTLREHADSAAGTPQMRFTATTAEIVVAADAPQTVRFAARELKTFLSQVLGADIPVVQEPTADKASIVLGMNRWAADVGISTNALVRDAFVLKAVGNRLFIAGRDDAKANPLELMKRRRALWAYMYERATLFGVYEFLERFAGVRFYFPGELGTVVPKKDAIDVPAIDLVVSPDWTVRRASIEDGAWYEDVKEPEYKNAIRHLYRMRLRVETRYQPFCHGQVVSYLAQRFHKTHPEYFIMDKDGTRNTDITSRMSGQLCHSSAVWEEIYQDAKHYLQGDPASVRGVITRTGKIGYEYGFQDRKYVDVMPQDGMRQCWCEKCQAAYKKGDRSFASELIWGNAKRAAERLTAEGVDGYLTLMAYATYRRLPSFDLPKNLLVMVAEDGPWSMRIPQIHERDNAEIFAWRNKVKHNICTWTYPCKYGKRNFRDVPFSTPRAVAAYYKSCAKNLYGSYMESNTERAYPAFLMHYIFFKFAWNTQLDTDAVLAEHYRLMYGAAADDVSAIADIYESKWLNEFLGQPVDTPVGPTSFTASEEEMWYKVYSQDVLADLARRFDAARAKVAPGSIEARRIDLMQRETLEPMQKASRTYVANKEAVKKWTHRLGRDDSFEVKAFSGAKGATAKEPVKTIARVWEEEGALKFEIVCEEPRMKDRSVRKIADDESEVWKHDNIEILLNPSGDRDVFYHFMINSEGSLTDIKHTLHDRGGDGKWNSGAKVSVTKSDASWKLELSIPGTSFAGPRAERFQAEIIRQRRLQDKTDDTYRWSPYARNNIDTVNFGFFVR